MLKTASRKNMFYRPLDGINNGFIKILHDLHGSIFIDYRIRTQVWRLETTTIWRLDHQIPQQDLCYNNDDDDSDDSDL